MIFIIITLILLALLLLTCILVKEVTKRRIEISFKDRYIINKDNINLGKAHEPGVIYLFKDKAEFYFVLKTKALSTIFCSDNYTLKKDCIKAIKEFQRSVYNGYFEIVKEDEMYNFKLYNRYHKVIAKGNPKSSVEKVEKYIRLIYYYTKFARLQ